MYCLGRESATDYIDIELEMIGREVREISVSFFHFLRILSLSVLYSSCVSEALRYQKLFITDEIPSMLGKRLEKEF